MGAATTRSGVAVADLANNRKKEFGVIFSAAPIDRCLKRASKCNGCGMPEIQGERICICVEPITVFDKQECHG